MKKLFSVFVMAVLLLSCGGGGNKGLGLVSTGYDEMDTALEEAMPAGQGRAPAEAPVTLQRKIIREGEIRFRTGDVKKTRQVILDAVTKAGGYLSDDSSNDYDGGLRHTMTLRMPAGKFDTVLAAVSSTASKLDFKNISTQDVTEQFIDTEARVKTKKELEARYKELLKRANTVGEVLEVERELGSLRSDIESVEGRLRYLTDRVAMSSLTVTFYEQGEGGFGFRAKMGHALHNGWDILLWTLIGFTHLWPFAVVGVIAFLAIRYVRKTRKRVR